MRAPVDLRSDTVTTPTAEMRQAMAGAEVGDDVYGEDPTVRRLEELAAEVLGTEAALFTPSGTMANQIAVLVHTRRGDEVLLEAESHIYYYEAGGIGLLSSCQPRPIATPDGLLTPEAVRAAVRPRNIHFPPPALLCLENTHNRAGGRVMTLAQTRALVAVARELGLRVHLDGARLFNAAVALGVDARSLVAGADSVMVSLSKGLGAPVGSVLAGPAAFVAEARRMRKALGGGMRQAGVLAAAGIVALTRMVERLAEDHARARRLAEGAAAIRGLSVPGPVETNIVMVDLAPGLADAETVRRRLAGQGVLCNAVGPRRLRFVTHKDVDDAGIERALQALADVVA